MASIDPFTPIDGLFQGIACGAGLVIIGFAVLVYVLRKGRHK